jgi:hypothetical protein
MNETRLTISATSQALARTHDLHSSPAQAINPIDKRHKPQAEKQTHPPANHRGPITTEIDEMNPKRSAISRPHTRSAPLLTSRIDTAASSQLACPCGRSAGRPPDGFRARERASSTDSRSPIRFARVILLLLESLRPRAILHAEPDARHLIRARLDHMTI